MSRRRQLHCSDITDLTSMYVLSSPRMSNLTTLGSASRHDADDDTVGEDIPALLDRDVNGTDSATTDPSVPIRGRGVSKWRNGEVESTLTGSRGPCYSKDELLDIYDALQRVERLKVPATAKIPMTLRREGPRLGIHELSCSEWIWITAKGPPYTTLNQKAVLSKVKSGDISPSDILVPMTVIRNHGIRGSDFGKVFEEQTDAKKTNLRTAAKEEAFAFGGASVRKFIEVDWYERTAELECEELCYLDSSSKLQGPFEKKRILQWWKHGYFPVRLQIRPADAEHFVQIDVLLAKWFAEEDLWHLQCDTITDPCPIFRNDLIDRFRTQQLEIDARVFPAPFSDAKRSIQVLHLMVHWLPFSETLLVKEAADVESMTITEAFHLWLREYRTQPGYLTVRPESWNIHFYIPIEKLMESYGFVE